MVWHDPIVAEIRQIREEYAAKFGYDIKAICDAAREHQQKAGGRVVARQPKRLAPQPQTGEN